MLELNALLFDVDGTIVNPEDAVRMTWRISLQKIGLPLLDDEIIKQSIGEVVQNTFPKYFPVPPHKVDEFVRIFREVYKTIPCKYFTPIDGVVDTLYRLRNDGFNLGIVANKEGTVINYVLGCLGISDLFPRESITCLDDGCKPKPNSELVETALRKMKLEKDYTAMVGDHVYDVIAGNGAGIKTIAVLSGTSSREEFEKYDPTLILPSSAEIPMYVRRTENGTR